MEWWVEGEGGKDPLCLKLSSLLTGRAWLSSGTLLSRYRPHMHYMPHPPLLTHLPISIKGGNTRLCLRSSPFVQVN